MNDRRTHIPPNSPLKNLLIEKNFKEPKFLAVITGGKFAYTTEDNVKVIPIGCLR